MGDNKKVANSVVALSSAAVLAIYGAGYAKTRAAADRFAQQATERRPHIPAGRPDAERTALNLSEGSSAPEPPPDPEISAETAPRADAPIEPATAPNVPAPPAAIVSSSQAKARAADIHTPPAPARGVAPVDKDGPVTTGATASSTAAVVPSPAETPAPAAPRPETPASTGTRATDMASSGTAPAVDPVPSPAPTPVTPPEPAKAGLKDGTYYGWGTSRHGDIQAAVVIESGRITVARVERCLTRYSCNWITPIPPRILSKQGTTYDYVSGATESSDAFQDAVAEALSQAK